MKTRKPLLLLGATVMAAVLSGAESAGLRVRSARVADAFPRAGLTMPLEVVVENAGSNVVRNVEVRPGTMPDGMKVVEVRRTGGSMFGGDVATFVVKVRTEKMGRHVVPLELRSGGDVLRKMDVAVDVEPSLGLPKAEYVPEPRPVETDYDIAAIYFPGWPSHWEWDGIRKTCPERKPVLGWYDEKNPEVVDWQIKWLVENGIRTLYVDWYWDRGRQWMDHWIRSYRKAKYRHLIKWAMMWANHNPRGSHSDADMRAVTKFWIENYFNMPEYLKVDGKPVVWIWSPQKIESDTGRGGSARLLRISREMAKAAGYEGIQFVAMHRPEAVCNLPDIRIYKTLGFDMTGGYRFMAHRTGITSVKEYEDHPRRYPFTALADAMPEHWRRLQEIGILPFMPNISTGWDDRPWKNSLEIYGKSVADFRRICEEAKKFADETGNKRICVGPLNEWGEGSYAEPNVEFGFGFYESVRDVFCKKPAGGWPLNYAPKDVGLGSYDMMPPAPGEPQVWDFAGGEPQGWRRISGLSQVRRTDEGIAYTTTSGDPAIWFTLPPRFGTEKIKEATIRLRTKDAAGGLQLFWRTGRGQIREAASISVKIVPDGEWHDYRFAVGGHKEWNGAVNLLRIDPGNKAGAEVEFSELRLQPQ